MKRILVAYDGQPPARRALDTAVELARAQDGAVVGVVSVVPFHAGRNPEDVRDDDAAMTGALYEATAILREAGIRSESCHPWGNPARSIEQVAADGEYDTIVIGSRGLGRVARIIRRSVSKHVVEHAGATVVVAR